MTSYQHHMVAITSYRDLVLGYYVMPFQILSLSGGGYLGLYTASILEKLEAQAKRPLGQCFDLIAGTSVGGIIALAIALEIPAEKIRRIFEEKGEEIFSARSKPNGLIASVVDVLRSALSPKYCNEALHKAVTEIIGDEKLIGDIKHPILVPAVNLSKGGPQVFKTPHHSSLVRDKRLKVVDVAMATSAAPTFFPLYSIPEEGLFADGGLFANSPDLLALHEAEIFFGVNKSEVSVLSVGTTTGKFSFSYDTGKNFGIWQWAKNQKLVRTSISSQQQTVDFMLKHQLNERYIRLDVLQSPEQEKGLALDVSTQNARLNIAALSEATFRDNATRKELISMLSHSGKVLIGGQ